MQLWSIGCRLRMSAQGDTEPHVQPEKKGARPTIFLKRNLLLFGDVRFLYSAL